jgi:hypothetical protein
LLAERGLVSADEIAAGRPLGGPLTRERDEALEQQAATSEILASISGSMTDPRPVFDAIVRNLLRRS